MKGNSGRRSDPAGFELVCGPSDAAMERGNPTVRSSRLSAPANRQSGFALISCMLISLIVITVCMNFTYRVRQRLRLAEKVEDRLEADLRAWSTLQEVLYVLSTSYFGPDGVHMAAPDQDHIFKIGGFSHGDDLLLNLYGKPIGWGDGVTVTLKDSSAQVALTSDTDFRFRLLLSPAAGSSAKTNQIVDSLQDWQDEDDLKHLNGAESWDYKTNGARYLPRNSSCQTLEELKLVAGMTPEIYEQLKPDLMLFNDGIFNYMNASPALLRALLRSDKVAERIVDYRDRGMLTPQLFTELTGIEGGEDLSFGPSDRIEVTVEAKYGEAASSIAMVYDKVETLKAPYQVELWKK